MTSEDDFQAALDANPDDWQTRLVFADWLQESDDPRAEGYRALGECRVAPSFGPVDGEPVWWIGDDATPALRGIKSSPDWIHYGSLVPSDWFEAIEGGRRCFGCWWRFAARRSADNSAALAFAKLPAERRAELRSQIPCEVS